MKERGYTTLQVKKDLHEELKEYCQKNGYKISGLVETLIKQKIHKKPNPGNILKVRND